jgi:hypothetical protein
MKKILLCLLFSTLGYSQTQIGLPINGEVGDFSGNSICLSSDGNIIAIGSYGNDDMGVDSG